MVVSRFVLIALTLVIIGATFSLALADTRPCAANFKEEGNLWGGKKFTTFELAQGHSQEALHVALERALVAEGYEIANTDKRSGTIKALNPGRPGRRASMDAAITEHGTGTLRVQLIFSLPSGMVAPTERVRDEFCVLLAKAEYESNAIQEWKRVQQAEETRRAEQGRREELTVAETPTTLSGGGAAQSTQAVSPKGAVFRVLECKPGRGLTDTAKIVGEVPVSINLADDEVARRVVDEGRRFALVQCPALAVSRNLHGDALHANACGGARA